MNDTNKLFQCPNYIIQLILLRKSITMSEPINYFSAPRYYTICATNTYYISYDTLLHLGISTQILHLWIKKMALLCESAMM